MHVEIIVSAVIKRESLLRWIFTLSQWFYVFVCLKIWKFVCESSMFTVIKILPMNSCYDSNRFVCYGHAKQIFPLSISHTSEEVCLLSCTLSIAGLFILLRPHHGLYVYFPAAPFSGVLHNHIFMIAVNSNNRLITVISDKAIWQPQQ